MATNNEHLLVVSGDVVVDETSLLQVAPVNATLTEDDNDNDITNLATMSAVYFNRLFGLGGLGLTQPADTANLNDGQAVATILTVNGGSGVTDLALTDSAGAALNGLDSELFTTVGNHAIYLYTDTNNNIVLGKYDSDADGSHDAVAFALVLDETSNQQGVLTGARMWIVQFEALSHTVDGAPSIVNHDDSLNLAEKVYVKASAEQLITNFDDAPANQNAWTAVDPDSSTTDDTQFLITGLNLIAQAAKNSPYGDSVNTRATSLGSNNQAVDFGEALRFDTVRGIIVPVDGVSADFTQNIQYVDHVEGQGLGVTLVQINGVNTHKGQQTKVEMTIFDVQNDTAQGNDFVAGLDTASAGDANNLRIAVASVEVRNAANQVVVTRTIAEGNGSEVGTDGRSYSFVFGSSGDGTGTANNQVTVGNLLVNQQIVVRSTQNVLFDRLLVKNVGDGSFDLGGLRILDALSDIDEIGSHVKFEDDGPFVDLVVSGSARLTLDETDNDADDNDIGGNLAQASITAATLFSTNTAAFGADGQAASDPTAFALSLGVGSNDSGLDTPDNVDILLYKEGNDIVGRAGSQAGDPVFRFQINAATGTVTATQYLAIKHDDVNDPDEAVPSPGTVLQTIASGRVLASRTITDGDGDTASDSVDISSVFNFEDDGPTAPTVTASTTATVTHDESPGLQSGIPATSTEDNNDDDVAGSTLVGGASIASRFSAIVPKGNDPHVAVGDKDNGAIGFARSGVALVDVSGGSFGSDGPASTSTIYALATGGGASGAQTTEGTEIFVFKEGALVVGRVGNELAGGDTANASGAIAFAIAINPATGEIYVAQYLSLKHATTASHDESNLATAAGASQIGLNAAAVQVTVSYTDKDGDTATSPAANIGSLVRFEDAGPSVTASASAVATLVHDETQGVQVDTDVAGIASYGAGTIASLFAAVPDQGLDAHVLAYDLNNTIGYARSGTALAVVTSSSLSSDGPGTASTSYALQTTNGTFSGVRTTEGTDIFLYNGPGGLLLGRVGTEGAFDTANPTGAVAFALAINPANGEVFIAQYLTIYHGNVASDDETSGGLAASSVQVVVTVTDGDGDTAQSSPVNVGNLISIQDSGPGASGTTTGNSLVTDDTDIPDTATVLAGSLFNAPNFGEDGPGAVTYALSLSAANANSGVVDTLTGNSIRFLSVGGDVVGYVDSDGNGTIEAGETTEALRYHINAKGTATTTDDEVEFTQSRAVVHDDPNDASESTSPAVVASATVSLVRSITDGDGDPATDTFDLGTISKIEDAGPTGFNPQDIVVGDGVKNQPNQSITRDLSGSALTSLTGVNVYTGKDGFGSVVFAGFANGTQLQGAIGNGPLVNLTGKAPGDTSSSPIYLFGAGSGTLVATTNSAAPAESSDWVFTITLNPGTDSYAFNMLGQIDNGAQSLTVDFAGQKQTIYEWLTLDLPGDDDGDVDGPDPGTTIDPAERDGDILFTGFAFDIANPNTIVVGPGSSNGINVSSTGIGVGDQSIDMDTYKDANNQNVTLSNGVFIDFVNGAKRTLDGQDPISALDFTDHYSVNNAGFSISQLKPNTNSSQDIRVSIYEELNEPGDYNSGTGQTGITDDPTVPITSITIRARHYDNGSKTFVLDGEASFTADANGYVLAGRSINVDFQPGNYVELTNLGEHWIVLINTNNVIDGTSQVGFERIGVQHVGSGNEGFDISGIFIEQFNSGDPVNLSFDLRLTDGDQDFTVMNDLLQVALAQPEFIL